VEKGPLQVGGTGGLEDSFGTGRVNSSVFTALQIFFELTVTWGSGTISPSLMMRAVLERKFVNIQFGM